MYHDVLFDKQQRLEAKEKNQISHSNPLHQKKKYMHTLRYIFEKGVTCISNARPK